MTLPPANPPPVGRLAPSPTGLLHLGHARSFLLAWWHVRALGGRILLRIEDLDGDRSRPEFVDAARRDLEWLGLDWDGPAHLQSEGAPALREALEQLLRHGALYPCICSRSDIRAAQSAPQEGDAEIRYPGTCRGRFATTAQAQEASGRPAGLRFLVPEGSLDLEDGFTGPFSEDVQSLVGDFLVGRKDGSVAYQLAVVVDDARQGVTEVLRGEDLLPSTARQWHLQEALHLPHPRWFHVPIVTDAGGTRLAKRSEALGLSHLRAAGVDPRAIVGWVARSAGQGVSERITAADLVDSFDLARLPHARPAFGEADLRSLLTERA